MEPNWRLIVFAILLASISALRASRQVWRWRCDEETELCRKLGDVPEGDAKHAYDNVELCRLTCGKYGALWPRPTLNCTMAKDLVAVDPAAITFVVPQQDDGNLLAKYADVFVANVRTECGERCEEGSGARLTVTVAIGTGSLTHHWDTSERYALDVTPSPDDDAITAAITADNYYGARHGLETLSQLFAAHDAVLYAIAKAHVEDKPIYRHRGLLLDTARNYLSVDAIRKQVRAMAASKMNVLHWHATDTQSFPLDLPRVPQLSRYGAYANRKVYAKQTVAGVIEYARLHGVRVLIEIDAPSHAGNGWQWGGANGLGDLAVCVNRAPWRHYCVQPPCGQLNPANAHVYGILNRLYADLVETLPPNEAFHMGGDEVFFPCWNSSGEILAFMAKNGWGTSTDDYLKLWGYFQRRALSEFDDVVGDKATPIVLWSSDLTEPECIEKYLDKQRYVIETWVPASSSLPEILLTKGYRLIISTKDAWYLDHGFWGNTLYHNWQVVYNNVLLQHKNVLGGEVCMWGELVDGTGVDVKIWPRAAAAAERLWSNPGTDSSHATTRFLRHRERLVRRGVNADAVVPRWCYQNEGQCN